MGNAVVKGGKAELFHVVIGSGVTKIVPEAQGHGRKQKAAVPAAVI